MLKVCWLYFILIILLAIMFLPYNLLILELHKINGFKPFIQYERHLCKLENNELRISFLENCKKSDIIPKFLKFRIPNNGAFHEESVHKFQKKLLHLEILKAKENLKILQEKSESLKRDVKISIPVKYLPAVMLHTKWKCRETRERVSETHKQKLRVLSEIQEKPLLNINNTVKILEDNINVPSYVIETLSLGPKHAILDNSMLKMC